MRIVYPDLRDRGSGLIGVRPKSVGAVVNAIGTPGFVDAVAALVRDDIALDALHLDRWYPGTGGAPDYCVEWYGSWGARYPDLSRLMEVYYRHYWHDDPLIRPARAAKGTLLLQRHVDGLAEGELRRRFFDEPGIAEECMLVHGGARYRYALSLARSRGQTAFSMEELFHVRQMVDMLFPMFESHVRICGARLPERLPAPTSSASPGDAFDARLARDDIALSQRERELCKLILNRWSVPQAASHLGIKLSTAKTYVERAFVKLGVRNRGELFAWAARAD